ncbi:acyl carrier protein [Oscillatoria sp. FACHB-1407]|uniref:acyl carrier protein n=1 Tax=Oscillatoria sp. FACHB-1407 TaxID=2692847 RepID=UPI0018EF46BC|nr:acyl carrier protein [Oscillatoria sp. FACHB-1407]
MVSTNSETNQPDLESSSHLQLTAAEIQEWIVSYLADLLEIESEDVNVTIPFDRYGLDSSVAVGMTGDLEDWMGKKLDPTLLYDYPTIETLAKHLAEVP